MKLFTIPLLTLSLAPLLSRADLVAHWTFDEGSGAVAADSTVNGFGGTIVGGALWNTTDLPSVPSGTTAAIELDGVDDQINIVGYKGVTGTNDRTISAWIKTATSTTALDQAIVSWGSNVSTQKWTFRVQSQNGTPGAIRIEANGGYLVGNTVVTDSEWHHVAVTWANDGSPDIQDAKLYVDGVLDAEFGSLDTPPSASLGIGINTASGNDVRIGENFVIDRNWAGGIDDVRIYDEALDALAIETLALGVPLVSEFAASEEVVASGSPVVLSWNTNPITESLSIDNGVGDVTGLDMITVNPTADTTYIITATRGATTKQREVTVLVESAPVIGSLLNLGSETLLAGQSTFIQWDVFGEASLSINGTDVTGEDQTELAPSETTTYTFSATNAFGTTTEEFTITVLDADTPNLSWTAAGLAEGLLAQWDPAINLTGNTGIAFINNTGGEVQTGASNLSGIGAWVNRPGYNLSSNPLDSFQDGLGNTATKEDVTWEMVFRPGDFTGTHVLFNTGGNGAGTGIVLTGSTLDFRFQTLDNDQQRIIISTDLAALGNATDFFHIVATADVGLGVPGTATLYVNGESAATPITSAGNMDDWDGGDLAELGKGSNIPTSTAFPFEAFTGDIAVFNYYQSRLLNASQIAAKYAEFGGGAGDLAITAIDYDAEASEVSITFTSIPGRTYALETSDDLASPIWVEIDDSIPADGAETSVVLRGITLPDPENPKRFYRIRPGVN